WMLSPVPTFLLWRRMKLWELRSYEQVIKLEQQRLVYQARLCSRFGRSWRRKAPVESLMPLRLARYGVPLAETAPAGLAAAGIEEPPIQLTADPFPVPPQRQSPELASDTAQEKELTLVRGAPPQQAQAPRTPPRKPSYGLADEGNTQHLADAYEDWVAAFGFEPTRAQFALWIQDQYGIATAAGGPLSDEQIEPLIRLLKQRQTLEAEDGGEPEPEAAYDAVDGWSDYFYNAWLAYAQEHGTYPDTDALAAYVYQRDQITGSTGQPLTGADVASFVSVFRQREFDAPELSAEEAEPDPGVEPPGGEPSSGDEDSAQTPAGMGAHPVRDARRPRVSASIEAGADQAAAEPAVLTTVDRYYLAWSEFQAEHGEEPKAEQLSVYLAASKGMTGRGGKPVSSSTLRRYLLLFRVYDVWAEQRVHAEAPSLEAVAKACAARGITAQHNRPLTGDYISGQAVDFERRWQVLTRNRPQRQQ
ncbi:hypothetical protein AB0E07_39290, partial [Streptomyces sp. NPDC048002]